MSDERPDVHESWEYDGGQPVMYWCKGHVDTDEFAREVEHQCGPRRFLWVMDEPEHTHMRKVPRPSEPGSFLLVEARPGPGAFPVTKAEIPWPPKRRTSADGGDHG